MVLWWRAVLLGVFTSALDVVSARGRFVAVINLLFFGGIFVSVLVAEVLFPPGLYAGWQSDVPEFFSGGGWVLLFVGTFLFNLGLASFVFVSLPGFVFFPLSAGALLYRAFLWGVLLHGVPNWVLVAVLPTLVLEGEAYVLAGVAGSVVGLSWLKPGWIYPREAVTRKAALKDSLRECLKLYVVVALFLVVAAAVETATIMLL